MVSMHYIKRYFFYFLVLFLLLIGAFIIFFNVNRPKGNSTLKLVHVIVRHGERHPERKSICAENIYAEEKLYPEGFGQLYNAGKRTEYQVGTYLRARYNDFLGPTWNINYLDARTSDYDRTKMSLLLILAGLYPPSGLQFWSSIYWQPIPYNYIPKSQDKELLPFYTCPRYTDLANIVEHGPEMTKYLQRYTEVFKVLEENCKIKIDVTKAFDLFVGFHIQHELGFKLEEWTKDLYPEPLHSLVIDMYYLMSNTTEIRKIISGYFLKKMLKDTQSKINGTLNPSQRKMFIYSGHEMNIATLIITLGLYERIYEIPSYGAYLLFEVHKIDEIYGIKIFYQNYKENEPVPLKIPGCDYFCPYEDFYRSLEKYLPLGEEECYGNQTT